MIMKLFYFGFGLKRTFQLSFLIAVTVLTSFTPGKKFEKAPLIRYSVSMDRPADRMFHVTLECRGLGSDTIDFIMPAWMPGYYQIMDYAKDVRNFSARTSKGKEVPFIKPDSNTWSVMAETNSTLVISYDVYSDKRFVANNFLDSTRAYIVTAATFMYPDGYKESPVIVEVVPFRTWSHVVTGLDRSEGKENLFTSPDFDILYDSPILAGNLEELPSFTINGIKHRFVAYNPGNFDREVFISKLEKTVKAGIDIIGDIPYKEYTFIGIGPGAGGIEHLNNTTVSFTGGRLDNPDAMKGTLKFLAHEYFHHYNVKRIRPFELGPFDYSNEARTNLLWVSEGLTVYYEYLMVRRGGIISDRELLASLESNINAYENDPGRFHQSLAQASYQTWSDGPFGNRSLGEDRTISYYDKGPLMGLILDFTIRNATGNEKSLDDVMRLLYTTYYKKLQRGFTDAEFQMACEDIAGISLNGEFEYVYTTKAIDYSRYLGYAGLAISEETDSKTGRRRFTIIDKKTPEPAQYQIFRSWTGV
jgi:predicted metalloprotease with PDZ domain